MSYLISQENKKLLWEILAEEGIFDGLPKNVTPEEVKHVFEKILKNLSANIPALHAKKLKELYHAKQQAIADEDYDAAKKIHTMILEMDTPVARLEKLEERKLLAVKSEDFETAKQIKLEIERIRMASFSLKELNKVAIKSLVINIPQIAKDISMSKSGGYGTATGHTIFPMASNTTHPPQNANVQEIYNAEDFHSRKRQEIETKLREKEAEMRAFLEVPRPKEIDFSDVPRDKKRGEVTNADDNTRGDDNDSPLANNSDDMEKIIAERIAARQRDLDEITEKMKAANPSQTLQSLQSSSQPMTYSTNDLDAPTPHNITGSLLSDSTPPNNGRKVRFQEDTENPIFLKLKKRQMTDDR